MLARMNAHAESVNQRALRRIDLLPFLCWLPFPSLPLRSRLAIGGNGQKTRVAPAIIMKQAENIRVGSFGSWSKNSSRLLNGTSAY
ncbi:hypothetical protein [Burkholderia sp. TSV86]|uniref:hypothetical protein n=1 Tax=Burkholderia sp. TSV86 TaxID=1385594 RepID=UPI000B06FA3E|nr:hypothetical protein [Burkholderia sp. TSV86]